MSEDDLYAQAWSDVNSGSAVPGIWAKAFAQAEGDENKAKALYITLWVRSKLPVPSEPVSPPPAKKAESNSSCPSCHSDDWKLCSMLHVEGIGHSKGEATSYSLGVGIGNGTGFGLMRTSSASSAIQQSELSRRATRPMQPKETVEQLIAAHKTATRVFNEPRLTAEIERISTLLIQHENYKDWPVARICMRCGTKFAPGRMPAEERVRAMLRLVEEEMNIHWRQRYGLTSNEGTKYENTNSNPRLSKRMSEEDEAEELYRKRIGLS